MLLHETDGYCALPKSESVMAGGGMRVQYVDPGRKEDTFVRRVRGDLVHDVIGILSRSFGISKAKMGTWVDVVSFAPDRARVRLPSSDKRTRDEQFRYNDITTTIR